MLYLNRLFNEWGVCSFPFHGLLVFIYGSGAAGKVRVGVRFHVSCLQICPNPTCGLAGVRTDRKLVSCCDTRHHDEWTPPPATKKTNGWSIIMCITVYLFSWEMFQEHFPGKCSRNIFPGQFSRTIVPGVNLSWKSILEDFPRKNPGQISRIGKIPGS